MAAIVNSDWPTQKTGGINKLDELAFVVYGERGIGKSTLVNNIFRNNAILFMFERDENIKGYKKPIKEWPTFCDMVDKIVNGKSPHEYSGVVIDNGAEAYNLALEYACKLHNIDHPGNRNDYGASWSKVRKEFVSPFRKLLNSPVGFSVVCHQLEKEIETRGGRKYLIMRPDWSNQADSFLGAFVENIWYYHYVGTRRFLQILGDEYVTAKTKSDGHFMTATGKPVHRIPMGNTESEAYANLVRAFNNKQAETFESFDKEGSKK